MNLPSSRARRLLGAASLVTGLLSVATAGAQSLPSNWEAVPKDDGGTVYRVVGLPNTSMLNVWALPPLPTAGMKPEQAFTQFKRKYGAIGFEPVGQAHCSDLVLRDGSISQECRFDIQGGTMNVTYLMLRPFRGDKADFYRFANSGAAKLLKPYAEDINDVLRVDFKKRGLTITDAWTGAIR